jgi:two-component system nitrogen regulation sensor histidine kinase GlnL
MSQPNPSTERPGLNFEEMLQSSCACGVLSLDGSGNVTFVSPEAEKILRLSQPGKPGLEKIPQLQELIRETQTTGRAINDRKLVLRPEDSTAVCVTVMPAATRDKNHRIVVLLKDFSSTNKLENNLQRLDRLASAGTLSAGMAHEIRNALVAVKTFIDLLVEKNKDDELADIVRHEMRRVDSIVSQMLKFSAPAQPTFTSISLHKVLDRCLRLAQHRVEGKLIAFERRFEAEPDLVRGDDHQLEQAFVNLLFNSVEAINSHGSLTISTEMTSDDQGHLREGGARNLVRIRISDTGGGIAAENMAHLFEPFFTTKRNGTGLGLAVTRRIIEEHSGTIDAESEPGKGTTFTVLLPAKE